MKNILLFSLIFSVSNFGISHNNVIVEPAFEMLQKFPNVRDLAMTSTKDEAYLTIQSPLEEVSVIAKLKKTNNDWSEPVIASFSGKYKDIEPFLSADGLRLYFASNRPLDDSINETKDFDIWYVERESRDDEWGNPINIGAPINTDQNEFYPSIAKNNSLYFTSDGLTSSGKDDIFKSTWIKDHYAAPESLGDSINTSGYDFNAYIAPDESFIIYTGYQREKGFGSGDLYINFKDDNQKWSTAINLGEIINSERMDYCPYYDSKSKTLYYTSRRSAIATINNFQTIKELAREIDQYENGLSRIYKVQIDLEKIANNNY